MIAEIANELLRVEDTSIAITIAVTTRGVEVSVRADSRLLGQDQRRIVRVIDYLLEQAFPGVSGFKHDRRPPHRVEGGACVPLTPEQRSEWRLGAGPRRPRAGSRIAGNGPVLAHCQELARQLVAALRDLETLQPTDMQGLLALVDAKPAREEPSGRRPETASWRGPGAAATASSRRRAAPGRRRRRAAQCSNSRSKPAMSSLAITGIARKHSCASSIALLAPQHVLEPVHQRQQQRDVGDRVGDLLRREPLARPVRVRA